MGGSWLGFRIKIALKALVFEDEWIPRILQLLARSGVHGSEERR